MSIVFSILFPSMLFVFGRQWLRLLVVASKNALSPKKKVKTLSNNKKQTPTESFSEKVKALQKYAFKRTLWEQFTLNKKFYRLIYALFCILSGITGFLSVLWGVILAIIFNLLWVILLFAFLSKKRNDELILINKILQFKKKYMGLVNLESNFFAYQEEFTLGWDKTNEFPQKITWRIPVEFEKQNRVKFLQALSENLGKGQCWFASEDDWFDADNFITTERKELGTQKVITFIQNCLTLKQQVLGGKVEPQSGLYTYPYEFTIDGFDKTGYPNKLTLKFPVGVDSSNELNITSKFSQQLGNGRNWEIDEDVPNTWDMERHELHLVLLDPLPNKAEWDDEYIFNEAIDPYYFPLGLSSKGGVVIKNSKTGQEERIMGYDPHGSQWSLMQQLGIAPPRQPASMINSPQVIGAGKTGGGKSVLLRNIENACLMRPKHWLLMICDMKRVEGSKFLKFGVPVGTTYEDCKNILLLAQKTMMERYDEMVKRDIVDYGDIPEEERGQAIMVIVDEAGELLSPFKAGKHDEQGQMNAEYQAQCLQAIESIYRLGRACMVHIQVFSQRIALDQGITMAIRNNASTRICAGPLDPTLSGMVFNSNLGTLVPRAPRGRVGLQVNDEEFIIQGFFAHDSYLEKWLENKYGKGNIRVYNNETMLELDKAIHSKSDEELEQMTSEEYEEFLKVLS